MRGRALPAPVEAARQRRWITPEPLNVAPQLVGLPLASPSRRAWAITVDLIVIGLLSDVSGFWLLGGLALVLLQLRSRRGGSVRGPRWVLGWVGAGLVLLLALQQAREQWQSWHPLGRNGAGVLHVNGPDARAEPELGPGEAGPGRADDAAAAATAASEVAKVDSALRELLPASAGTAGAALQAVVGQAASAAAAEAVRAASASASAPRLGDAQRIAQLEAELAEARHPKPLHWKDRLGQLLDDLGAGLGWGIVYFSLLPAWWGGQTVGKKLLRLRVVELTGKPMTVMRCLKRYGGYAAGVATGGLGFFQVLWDPNRQAIQDKTAHTAVIDLRAARAEGPG